jgi:hypothetical protein
MTVRYHARSWTLVFEPDGRARNDLDRERHPLEDNNNV